MILLNTFGHRLCMQTLDRPAWGDKAESPGRPEGEGPLGQCDGPQFWSRIALSEANELETEKEVERLA